MLAFFPVVLFSPYAYSQNNSDYVPGELIVKYKTNSVRALESKFSQLKVQKTFSSSGAHHVLVDSSYRVQDVIAELEEDPNVEYVERNYYIDIKKTPNDPNFSKQYGLRNTGQWLGTKDADVKALKAWDLTTGSRNVLVAVIDTGVDYRHPDLIKNYWVNPGESGTDSRGRNKRTNGIDDDRNGYVDDYKGWDFSNEDNDPEDDYGHGTHCAGVIGARGGNGIGVTGINWRVSIMGLKIFSKRTGRSSVAASIEAIEYASKMGAHIINASWGGVSPSKAQKDAISAANRKKVLFVAAAGNERTNTDFTPHYPSSYDVPNIISVAATNRNDKLAGFSNYGFKGVDIAAPGASILSTYPGERYRNNSGTSMAAPHVAGAAALIKARFSKSTASSMKRRILNEADRIENLKSKIPNGRRLNIFSSLQ